MIHTIIVEIPDHIDGERAEEIITRRIDNSCVGSTSSGAIITNVFAEVVEYHREKVTADQESDCKAEDVTVLATRHEAIGKLEFDGITYGVEVTKDEDRRTNIKFTSDPPFSKTYDRVVYEWTGRLEKDR